MSVPSVPVEENNQFELWRPNKQSLREKTAQMPEISKASSVVITLQDLREYLDEHSEKCRGCGKPPPIEELRWLGKLRANYGVKRVKGKLVNVTTDLAMVA